MDYSYDYSAYSTYSGSWMSTWALIAIVVLYLVLAILCIVGVWKIFKKAWQKWREALIPMVNLYLLNKMLWKPDRHIWGLLIPFMNIVALLVMVFSYPFAIAKKFGKSTGFGVWLLFLPIIFIPILWLWKAQYQK